jgi:protein-tyrosine phosphatase
MIIFRKNGFARFRRETGLRRNAQGQIMEMRNRKYQFAISICTQYQVPTMADSECILVEYVNFAMKYSDMKMTLDCLREQGFIPIIAHMERYYALVLDIAAAKALHDDGCYIQINAYSVTDGETEQIRNRAKELLDAGIVDFIGSDAHRTYHRPPNISRGIRTLYENYDKDYVDRMVYKNVEDLILGKDIMRSTNSGIRRR